VVSRLECTSHLDVNYVNQIDTNESSLLITEPYFNLPNIQDVYDQFVFEEYEFRSYYRCTRELPKHAFGSTR
jgi:actin-related protein